MRSARLLLLLLLGACTRTPPVQPAADAAPAVPPGLDASALASGPDAGAPDAAVPPKPVEAKGFAQRFVDFVKQADAAAPVKATGDLEVKIADKAPTKLDRLLKECQAAPADCDGAMSRTLTELAHAEAPPKVALQSLTVSLLPAESAKDRMLYTRPFAGPLAQVLMLASPDTVVPLSEKDLKALKTTEAAAWARALANLRAVVKEPIAGKPFVDDAPA